MLLRKIGENVQFDDWVTLVEIIIGYACFVLCYFQLLSWLIS